MFSDNDFSDLSYLNESSLIKTEEKNLRSKIESILRSLNNLTSKKERIEYEIRKQKKALFRKREELKVSSKRLRKQGRSLSESSNPLLLLEEEEYDDIQRYDAILLRESSRLLDE